MRHAGAIVFGDPAPRYPSCREQDDSSGAVPPSEDDVPAADRAPRL